MSQWFLSSSRYFYYKRSILFIQNYSAKVWWFIMPSVNLTPFNLHYTFLCLCRIPPHSFKYDFCIFRCYACVPRSKRGKRKGRSQNLQVYSIEFTNSTSPKLKAWGIFWHKTLRLRARQVIENNNWATIWRVKTNLKICHRWNSED